MLIARETVFQIIAGPGFPADPAPLSMPNFRLIKSAILTIRANTRSMFAGDGCAAFSCQKRLCLRHHPDVKGLLLTEATVNVEQTKTEGRSEVVFAPEQQISYDFTSRMDCISMTTGFAEFEVAYNSDARRPIVIAPMTAIFRPAGTTVKLRSLSKVGAFFMVTMDKDVRETIAQVHENKRFQGIDRPLTEVRFQNARALQRALRGVLAQDTSDSQTLLDELVSTMLHETMLHEGSPTRQKASAAIDDASLNRLCEMIEDSLGRPLSLTDMAECIGKDQFTLIRAFKTRTGITPHQYLMERRAGRVRNALRDRTKPLVDIAYETGFSSQAHMTSVFSKCFGSTPALYRKLHF